MSVDWCKQDLRQNGSRHLGDPRSDDGVLGRHTDAHTRVLRVGAMADRMTSEVRAGLAWCQMAYGGLHSSSKMPECVDYSGDGGSNAMPLGEQHQ